MNTKNSRGILFVDDEQINLKCFWLRFNEEFDVFTSTDATTALHLLDSHPHITIIVSDYLMPGMDGIEFIRKARLKFPDKHYFLLTGYDGNEAITQAIQENLIVRNMKKPVEYEEMFSAFNSVLE